VQIGVRDPVAEPAQDLGLIDGAHPHPGLVGARQPIAEARSEAALAKPAHALQQDPFGMILLAVPCAEDAEGFLQLAPPAHEPLPGAHLDLAARVEEGSVCRRALPGRAARMVAWRHERRQGCGIPIQA